MTQVTRSTFQGTNIPTINDGGSNTAAEVRALLTDFSDSVLFLNENKATKYITMTQPGSLAVADGSGYGRGFPIPIGFNGRDLVEVIAVVGTAGSSGSANLFQLRRVRSGSPVDMLSTRLMIDAGEATSETAATPYVINTSNDDVATGDTIYLDIDQLNTTPPQNLTVYLGFR